jgi:hypothetical protein
VASHSEAVFAIAAQLPNSSSTFAHPLRAAAFAAIAERDPRAALARLEAMPRTAETPAFVAVAVEAYARTDPDAALAWVAATQGSNANLGESIVARTIADSDTRGALRIVGNGVTASTLFLGDSVTAARVADELFARGVEGRVGLANGVGMWAYLDPRAAMAWASAHAPQLDGATATVIAGALATIDPTTAARVGDALSTELRSAAVVQVVGPLAAQNAHAALAWVSSLEGQPHYESALQNVVASVAITDAAEAARMLDRASPAARRAGAQWVVGTWVSQDPAATARWTVEFEDADVRDPLLAVVAESWARRDRAAAGTWALGLPGGAARDAMLKGLIASSTQRADFDARIVDALSTDTLRERVVVDLITTLPGRAGADASYAQYLLDRYVRDPALQHQAAAAIDRLRRSN